jgi:hypothetical protein
MSLLFPRGPERRPRHHRRDTGQRREILSLPDDDPVHSIGEPLGQLTIISVRVRRSCPAAMHRSPMQSSLHAAEA